MADPMPSEITVEQLLRHTSGIADIFTDTETRFVLSVFTHKKASILPLSVL